MALDLYHESEAANIAWFEPRPPQPTSGLADDVVWAVDEEHLRNILLPRVTPSLWKLRDAVVASTLRLSCIRMRHAQPRPQHRDQKPSNVGQAVHEAHALGVRRVGACCRVT